MKHSSLVLMAALALPAAGLADTIHRTDGKPIEDCEVERETLTEVTYKQGKDRETIPADKVVRIEYEKLPKLLAQAEDSLKSDELEPALADIQTYLDAVLAKEDGDKQHRWAPAYALERLIGLRAGMGDDAGVVEAADRLIEAIPDSRHVPAAYLAKAEALAEKNGAKAVETLRDLVALAESKGLSKRWKLSAELQIALLEAKDDALRAELERIKTEAGQEFPTVQAQADLAQAESYLAAQEFAAAEKLLDDMLANRVADDRTMAGAYTALGDCRFKQAVSLFEASKKAEAEAMLQEALLNYMRVVVTYADEPRYVPKAMFFAGRAFDLFQDEESKQRAKRMYQQLTRRYESSSWAADLKKK